MLKRREPKVFLSHKIPRVRCHPLDKNINQIY